MADHDLLSCSPMVTTSNEFSFNLSMEYAPNWGHWVSTSNSFQWINPLLNWNYLFARIGFSTQKKKKTIMNKSSSLLLQLYLHLLQFFDNEQIFIFHQKKKKRQKTKFSKKKNQFFLNLSKKRKEKKKKKEIFKKGLGTRGIWLVLLRLL